MMLVHTYLKRLVFLAFFYASIFLTACESEPKHTVISLSGPTMGTTYNIKIVDEGQGYSSAEIQRWVDTELLHINQVFSTYIPDSEISLFNRSPIHAPFSVSDSFCALLGRNITISQITAGRYDITIGPLVNLWGFGPEKRQGLPSQEEITAVRQRVGYRALELDCDNSSATRTKEIYTDLSASAKGYATDQIASLLSNKGFNHAMIEIGGELHLLGQSPSNKAWRIAIERPSVGRSGAVQVLKISDAAVATSGDYRNYYEVDGRRISHTIDPVTSSPITHKLASVTVVMEDGASADAWATAFNVLGPEKGFELATQQDIAAYFIIGSEDDAFSVKYTPQFERFMVKK